MADNLKYINREIVKNFYDLCCAGEERNQRFVGSKVVDGGDINQSIEGVTALGRGQVDLSVFYKWKKANYREGVKERSAAGGALRQAENNFTLGFSLGDARNFLALITGPKDVLTLTMLEEIYDFLEEKSPKSVIRLGDYPRRAREISVTLLASSLTRVPRMEELFLKAEKLFVKREELGKETKRKIKQMQEIGKDLPTLI